MIKDFEKIIAIFEYLNFQLKNPSLDENFRERLTIQKVVFISKSLGIEMSYKFNLYKKGPYCPQLTEDYYNDPTSIMSFKTNVKLTNYEINILNKIKLIVFSHPIYFKYRTDLLQAISTILYMKDNDPNLVNDDLMRLTKAEKPYLSDRMIIIAINLVKKLNT